LKHKAQCNFISPAANLSRSTHSILIWTPSPITVPGILTKKELTWIEQKFFRILASNSFYILTLDFFRQEIYNFYEK